VAVVRSCDSCTTLARRSGLIVFPARTELVAASRVRASVAVAVAEDPLTDTTDEEVLLRSPEPAARTGVAGSKAAACPVCMRGVGEVKVIRTPRISSVATPGGSTRVSPVLAGGPATQVPLTASHTDTVASVAPAGQVTLASAATRRVSAKMPVAAAGVTGSW